ncbi:LOW QUALITY PROTEIN: hypothetical protein PHMEG_00017425 [Phytophthora megakarya]|uniref:Uncharacterized protein n=1 Tax=Phytophthora megakarya TaxID=4795 RepID=A0A225VWL3_9STRA|nr:LOW QUALITY PROTEIN: hypothetical protein PHMEG_00017425 [Phytophthora megakarya]
MVVSGVWYRLPNKMTCLTPTVKGGGRIAEPTQSPIPASDDITASISEKSAEDDDSNKKNTIIPESQQNSGKSRKTGCREPWSVKPRSGRVSKPPPWLGDTLHLAFRSSLEKNLGGSCQWNKEVDQMQLEMAKEKAQKWWEDYTCILISSVVDPNTLEEATCSKYASMEERC